MHRVLGVCALVLSASLAAGCGGSHVSIGPPPHSVTPIWLTKIMSREATLLSDPHPNPTEITFGKQQDVVEMFGEFTTPAQPACTTGYCPVPFRLHVTSVRLVVSARTHRLVSAALGRQIAHTQAPGIARRSSRFLSIFSPRPGTIACGIPRGGVALRVQRLRGRCTTAFVSSPTFSRSTLRILFGERWRLGGRAQRAGWIVTVRLRDGTVQATHVFGQPPQLWK